MPQMPDVLEAKVTIKLTIVGNAQIRIIMSLAHKLLHPRQTLENAANSLMLSKTFTLIQPRPMEVSID
jgi:hypothetical protein